MTTMHGTAPVSVVIPTYNRANYLKECLDAVLRQSLPARQIIVVDDGSGDATQSLLDEYAGRVVNVRKENGGKPAALNHVLHLIEQDYVWFFDDDDVPLPESIALRLHALRGDPSLDFVYTGHYLGTNGPDGRIVRGERYVPACPQSEALLAQLMIGCYFTLQGVLLKRNALRRVGLFDESLISGQDYDFMLRLAMMSRGMGLVQPSFVFRQHTGRRGPEVFSYSAAQRQQVFCKFEQLIGRKLRAATELGDFVVPRGTVPPGSMESARAVATRMVVMASKGLIPELFEDMKAVLRMCPALPDAERRLIFEKIDRSMRTGYVCEAIHADAHQFLRQAVHVRKEIQGRRALLSMTRGLLRLATSYPAHWRKRLVRLRLSVSVALLALVP